MFDSWKMKTSGKVVAKLFAKMYWEIKEQTPTLSDDEVINRIRDEQLKAIARLIATHHFSETLTMARHICGMANKLSTLCEVYMIVNYDFVNYSQEIQEKTLIAIDDELRKYKISENLIGQ